MQRSTERFLATIIEANPTHDKTRAGRGPAAGVASPKDHDPLATLHSLPIVGDAPPDPLTPAKVMSSDATPGDGRSATAAWEG